MSVVDYWSVAWYTYSVTSAEGCSLCFIVLWKWYQVSLVMCQITPIHSEAVYERSVLSVLSWTQEGFAIIPLCYSLESWRWSRDSSRGEVPLMPDLLQLVCRSIYRTLFGITFCFLLWAKSNILAGVCRRPWTLTIKDNIKTHERLKHLKQSF